MEQKIICSHGKCLEEDNIKTEFDDLFDDTDIVQRIEHDLINYMIG